MQEASGQLRYTYVKFDNVVEQLNRIRSTHPDLTDGGPDAFVASFLRIAGTSPTLILGIHSYPDKEYRLQIGPLGAQSYYWRRGFSLRSLVSRIVVTLRIYARLIRFRPNYILCWQEQFPLWICYLSARQLGATFVVSRHTRFPEPSAPWYRRITGAIDKWVVKHSSAVICHGPYLEKGLIEIGVSPANIYEFDWSYEDFVSITHCEEAIPELDEESGTKLILFVGRIFEKKGVYDLLEACKERLQCDTRIKLVYAGDGPHLETLRSRVRKLGVEGKVLLPGRVRRDMLPGLIRRSTMLVAPTQSRFPEGRCESVIEGLILGVPVVAPNFGPFPYVVEDRVNGVLFEPDSVKALKAGIELLLDQDPLYEKLKEGAKQGAVKLLNPALTYPQAVERAFKKEKKLCN